MPNFHFFLFSLWQLINHLPAKDSLYSRQRRCFPRLYPWQLVGVGSCPDMLQQTQAILFIVKDQQGFLSFGGGLLVLFGSGVFLTSEASCAPPFFLTHSFCTTALFQVSAFEKQHLRCYLSWEREMKNHAEVMQQILKVQISKFRIVRRFLVLTVRSVTFWADALFSISERSEEFKLGTLKITSLTKKQQINSFLLEGWCHHQDLQVFFNRVMLLCWL